MPSEFDSLLKGIDTSKYEKFVNNYKLPPKMSIGGIKYDFKGCQIEIDKRLKMVCDDQFKLMANNGDLCVAVTGMEGSGKSLGLALTMCTYYSHKTGANFSEANIVFTPKQFENLIEFIKENKIKGAIIMWDEFVFGGLSGDGITKMQKLLVKHFMTMRNLNIFTILVMPTIFMMNSYFATHRTRFLVHATLPDGITRGSGKIYGYSKKNFLYNRGLKYKSYGAYTHDFSIKFMDVANKDIVGGNVIDFDKYEEKKNNAMKEINEESDGTKNNKMLMKYKNAVISVIDEFKKLKYKRTDIARITGMSAAQITLLNKEKEKTKAT